ncbi:MAG TPA: alpha-amylase family glycosyl hydrolase [Bellilinea sp.]|nr:alpha-amylase family glycosyl hydrolase [Bellilinea sp.]
MFEFHISRLSRDRYAFDQSLFTFNGNVIFANFHAARMFAEKMNLKRDLVNFPERAVKSGQINAMGLLDEILHLIITQYRQQKNPNAMTLALGWLDTRLGQDAVDQTLIAFTQEFPPIAVYSDKLDPMAYLQGSTEGRSHRAIALEEMLMLWISNKNPALDPYQELFVDNKLKQETAYQPILDEVYKFFQTQPTFGPDYQNLIDVLRAPALAHPYSLTDQLEYIRQRWSEFLGQYLYRLLSSLDLIKEEEKLPFLGPGPVPIPVYGLGPGEADPENFSQDREWMPRLVLLAKNAYVWLDQLRRKYEQPIYRLDQVPDEELQEIASRGFTGLWLIGLWERSQASARIKQLSGNAEAIASAYSLAAYQIAADLGGEDACSKLREKAWRHGIRLASDMVPNHMGIDSSWLLDRPDWFIGLDYTPYPGYTFDGPDLSPDGRVGIYLEDHYFSRTDAAVVFKRVDRQSGSERFIYHGNDGTTMPWNDTAQLNYLNPEVREQVIQTILDVARRFPIIRFDAAMTLAKRHFQRLWFPEPGTGGAIPSRADHALTKEQFDQAMPVEFWREVVDRVAREVPDTLLLAEAFWLMEGYFVRTLGMHRVYNSAFMNMLRNEENANYRKLIKNTLEFEPEILKRYVNFMNNPDERTAVDQFGKGDKYFGVCVMLSTLPGLPMFGHGQVEGFTEKYGMEFRKAYWDEQEDTNLVDRHRREVFPLLHQRHIFSGVENFLLYDFYSSGGWVNEDVYAYSNQSAGQRGLVVYHNKFASTEGWVKWSAAYKSRSSEGLKQLPLLEGLGLAGGPNVFIRFRDSLTGLEYIRPASEIADQGLHLNLAAYEAHVFLDFREVVDDEQGMYRSICDYLNGRGVPNIDEALQELILAPIMTPFNQIINRGYLEFLLNSRLSPENQQLPLHLLDEAEQKMAALVDGIQAKTGASAHRTDVIQGLRRQLQLLLALPTPGKYLPISAKGAFSDALKFVQDGLTNRTDRWVVLLTGLFIHDLGKLTGSPDYENQSLSWLEEWQFSRRISEVGHQMGIQPAETWKLPATLHTLIGKQRWYEKMGSLPVQQIMQTWLSDVEIQRFLGVNRYQDILWFSHEAFEDLVWWMVTVSVLQVSASPKYTLSHFLETILGSYEIALQLLAAEEESDFQVPKLIVALGTPGEPV